MPSLTLLHTNDLHGKLTSEGAARLRALRGDADLYFDTGDAIRAGNLGVPLGIEEVWGLLASVPCDASVIGNRETHVLEAAFRAKLRGAAHPVLCANLRDRAGHRPLAGHLILEVKGLKVGVLAVSVPMVTERMKTRAASAFLWDAPIPVATELARELRPQVDVLIALTHIGTRQDRELAEKAPMLDLIMGGHSHDVLIQPERVGGVSICQGGSHSRFVGRYVWRSGGLAEAELLPLQQKGPPA